LNYRHLSGLRPTPGIPWSPNLGRLEKLTLVKEMSPADYREAWAWVHYMLRGSPEAKTVLLNYVQQLRHTRDPGPFEPHLALAIRDPEEALRQHIAKLESETRTLAGAP
jgi:hypothetical protein